MNHHNEMHGGSRLYVHTFREGQVTQWLQAVLSSAEMLDKNFEIVYTALETFEDGYEHAVICYRLSTPGWSPKIQGLPPTQTKQLFVEKGEGLKWE